VDSIFTVETEAPKVITGTVEKLFSWRITLMLWPSIRLDRVVLNHPEVGYPQPQTDLAHGDGRAYWSARQEEPRCAISL
jgi:hypothetical protein